MYIYPLIIRNLGLVSDLLWLYICDVMEGEGIIMVSNYWLVMNN